jgi:hypothetical protein
MVEERADATKRGSVQDGRRQSNAPAVSYLLPLFLRPPVLPVQAGQPLAAASVARADAHTDRHISPGLDRQRNRHEAFPAQSSSWMVVGARRWTALVITVGLARESIPPQGNMPGHAYLMAIGLCLS